MEKNETSKEKILQTLKKGKLATSRIAGIIGYDYNYTTRLLEELVAEKQVKKIQETVATYWEIRK